MHRVEKMVETEIALIISEQRYREIFDNTSDCIFLIDVCEGPRFRYSQFNKAEEKSVGLKNEQVAGKFVEEIFEKELAEQLHHNYLNCVRSGARVSYEECLELPSGIGYFYTSLIPIKDAGGQIVRIVGIARDISELKKKAEELKESNHFLQKMTDTVPLPIYYKDVNGIYIGCNSLFEKCLGLTKSEIIGQSDLEISRKSMARSFYHGDADLFQNPGIQSFESTVRYADGSIHIVVFHKAAFYTGNGEVAGLVGTMIDITEHKKMEDAINHRIVLETAVAKSSRLFVSMDYVDLNEVLGILGMAVSVNRAYIFRLRENGTKMDNTNEWCSPGTSSEIDHLQDLNSDIFPWWMNKLSQGENIEISNVNHLPPEAAGEQAILQAQGIKSLIVVPVYSTDAQLNGFMGFDDIEKSRSWTEEDVKVLRVVAEMVGVYWERKRAAELLQYQATHDILTHIPNRFYLDQRLEKAVQQAQSGEKSALLLIDLDNFKLINDTLGHKTGDELLIALVDIFQNELGEGAFLSRLGGDEFAVLLENVSGEEAAAIAEKLRRAVWESNLNLITHEFRLNLSISIGIIVIDGTMDCQKCLAFADTALYDSKENGRNKVSFAQPGDETVGRLAETNSLLSLIRNCIQEDRFILQFQPVFALHDRKIIHYEALIRLQDLNDQIISPGSFIPVAESFGLMPQIDLWVVKTSLQLLREYPDLKLFINLSGLTLGDEGTLRDIEVLLNSSGIEPSRICFEITETAVVKDLLRAERWIRKLKKTGCQFALDDFGIGFSSFSYLRTLPVDMIKIDGSFVQDADKEPVHKAIIQAINSIASTLGMQTIAEFIENEAVFELLKSIGIDYGQGFFLGKPSSNLITRL